MQPQMSRAQIQRQGSKDEGHQSESNLEIDEANQDVDYTDPSAKINLNEYEMQAILSRPWMDPDHAKFGNKPNSNQVLYVE